MTVQIFLKETSQRIKFEEAQNSYTKGPFFCVLTKDNFVYKYPVANIFNVKETY